jgi:outer membrane receptor for monomeric catechols
MLASQLRRTINMVQHLQSEVEAAIEAVVMAKAMVEDVEDVDGMEDVEATEVTATTAERSANGTTTTRLTPTPITIKAIKSQLAKTNACTASKKDIGERTVH